MEGSEMPMDGIGMLIAGSATVVGARGSWGRGSDRDPGEDPEVRLHHRTIVPGTRKTDRYICLIC